MGIISGAKDERATYIAVMLFLLTAVIGVGLNVYWIAKPIGLIALGSVFSTTHVFPYHPAHARCLEAHAD